MVLLYEVGYYDFDIQSQEITEFKAIEAPKCGAEGFYLSEEEKSVYSFDDFYCLDKDYHSPFIQGMWASLKNKNVAVTIRSCQVAAEDKSECASQSIITEKADKVSAYIYYCKYFLESDDYGTLEPKSVMKY